MKKYTPLIIACLVIITWFGWTAGRAAMNSYVLADLYGEDWSLKTHGLVFKHSLGNANYINIQDLEPLESSSTDSQCRHIESLNQSKVTLSIVGSQAACCQADQHLVPYRDDHETGYRYYLCGYWPDIDYVRQSLESVKISHTLSQH